MSFKEYWMDVLRAAAIIGVVMALSHIIEQYVLLYSDMSLYGATLVLMAEGLVSAAAFVFLLFYFTRRIARAWNGRVEFGNGVVVDMPFTYGRAVSYGLLVAMLAGLLVGVVNTLFVDFMGGYDVYRAEQIAYIEEMKELMSAYNAMVGSEVMPMDMMDGAVEQLENVERPSMFMTILSQMSTYMLYGGIASLVVAAVARRKPKAENVSNE
jgi:hypothetical protein